jgi:hypothetical protein
VDDDHFAECMAARFLAFLQHTHATLTVARLIQQQCILGCCACRKPEEVSSTVVETYEPADALAHSTPLDHPLCSATVAAAPPEFAAASAVHHEVQQPVASTASAPMPSTSNASNDEVRRMIDAFFQFAQSVKADALADGGFVVLRMILHHQVLHDALCVDLPALVSSGQGSSNCSIQDWAHLCCQTNCIWVDAAGLCRDERRG